MFFILPVYNIMAIYVAAALIPAIFLMRYIYRKDTIEKEPPQLLWKCIGAGVLAVFASIVLETIGESILNFTGPANKLGYTAALAFLIVAVVEEGTKYLFMSRVTWRSPEFNYRFDGIVYAAYASLGFAALENIKYVFAYGLSVAVSRAFLSIPGHLGFSVLFGYFYGRAKFAANRGMTGRCKRELFFGYLLAVLAHGFYDFCAMLGSSTSTLVFVTFVIIMYIVIIRLLKRESWTDEEID